MGSFKVRTHRLLVALVAGLLVAAACQPTPGGQPPTGEAKKGGRLIVGSQADAKLLNAALTNDSPSNEVASLIYRGLLKLNAKTGEYIPELAEKFEISSDSKTYTFTLRSGLVWSDGTPLTGEDFKFTAEAVMRSKITPRHSNFNDIVGAKDFQGGKAETISGITVSGNTITVNFNSAFCPALGLVGSFGIIPRHVFGKYADPKDLSKNIDSAPENIAPPVSSGPFKFRNWTAASHITLDRNDRYYLGAPLLDEFVFKVVPDSTALGAALKTGEVDMGLVQPSDRDDLKAPGHLNFHSYLSTGYTYIGWNQLRSGKEFFQSKNIRHALAYGINMDAVVERLYLGEGKKQIAHHPPISWAYDPTGLNEYKFDQAKARQLIEVEGWTRGADGIYQKGGQRLAFNLHTNSDNRTRMTFLQVAIEQYKQIGVEVTARPEAFPALVDRLTLSRDAKYGDQGGHDFDAVIIGWTGLIEPDAHSIWHSSNVRTGGFNFVGYKNPTVDQLIVEGRTSCKQEDRKKTYAQFNKILNEDQPYNFGIAGNNLLFVNKRIQGVDPGSFGSGITGAYWGIEKFWIKQ